MALRLTSGMACIRVTWLCHLQVSATDLSASDPQTAAVQELGKAPRASGTQQAAEQPSAPQQAEPGSQMAAGSGSHSGAKPPPGHNADPGEAGGAGAESPAGGEHGRASEPQVQAQVARQRALREGAGASAGGARGAALQGQLGPPASQQASSSRQGSGATAAPSRCLTHQLLTTGPVFLALLGSQERFLDANGNADQFLLSGRP